jgi:hypothetical protein
MDGEYFEKWLAGHPRAFAAYIAVPMLAPTRNVPPGISIGSLSTRRRRPTNSSPASRPNDVVPAATGLKKA